MQRSHLTAPLAALAFLVAALAIPGTAISHGLEHSREHVHAVVQAGAAHADADEGLHVSTPDRDHEHPRLDQGLRSRSDDVIAPFVHAQVLTVPTEQGTASHPPRSPIWRSSGDPSTGPPPRLRSPPHI